MISQQCMRVNSRKGDAVSGVALFLWACGLGGYRPPFRFINLYLDLSTVVQIYQPSPDFQPPQPDTHHPQTGQIALHIKKAP